MSDVFNGSGNIQVLSIKTKLQKNKILLSRKEKIEQDCIDLAELIFALFKDDGSNDRMEIHSKEGINDVQ